MSEAATSMRMRASWRLRSSTALCAPSRSIVGVVLPLRLTHGWLANLVGAQRPSVTTALGNLAGAGLVERLDDGSWLLRGEPPNIDEPLFSAGSPTD